MIQHLFVYGTLAPNRPNAHILQNIDPYGSWQPATIKGTLEQKGWGAEMGYNGLRLSQDSTQQIAGLIFSSEYIHQHWAELDHFEGQEYKRVLHDVVLDDGHTMKAYVYALT